MRNRITTDYCSYGSRYSGKAGVLGERAFVALPAFTTEPSSGASSDEQEQTKGDRISFYGITAVLSPAKARVK